MSIYVGESTKDLNYLMNNDTVSASVYVGNDHVWPLYEFSFYDGIMQKTVDNITAKGDTKTFTLRTCEDSWWHKLDFDIHYTLLSSRTTTPAVSSWLNRFAQDFIVDTDTNWLEVSVDAGTISPTNSLTVQNVSFDDHYSSFDGGTCNQGVYDTQLTCKIYANQWFLPREGKLHCAQYDEWSQKTKGQVGNGEIAAPSDNYPTIFFTQAANEWGSNAQKVEFSATPATTGAQGGTVNLKWKIYSDSTSGYTIYYGDDIASNNTSKDGPEEYAVGKMWITINGSSALRFNNDASYNGTTKEWTATATWADNLATGSNASHNIVFDTPDSVGTNGGDYTITAACIQSSQPRYATITLNVGDKNNWRPASSSANLSQEGETISTTCYVSLSNDFSDEATSISVNFPAISEPTRNYSLSLQDSSLTQVGPEAGSFNVISYYTTESADGKSVTIYAKCPDGENTASTTITQASLGASKVAVGVTADCVDGTESVSASATSSTYVATITYSEHSTPGEYSDEIVVTQNESGYTVSVVHIAKVDIKKTYTYKVVIATSSTATSTTTSVNIADTATSNILYGRLFESCYCTIDGVYSADDSYDNKAISWATNSESGASLSAVSFSLSGGTNVSGTSVWSLTVTTPTDTTATACELKMTGAANNDMSSENIRGGVDFGIVTDTYITIGNAVGNTASFTVAATRKLYTGGYRRSGSVEGSYSGAYASTSFTQNSSVQQTATGTTEVATGLTLSCTCDKTGFSATGTETSTAGTYNVVIKVTSVWQATTDASVTGWSGLTLSYNDPVTGKYTVVASDVDSDVTLKVSATGKKQYRSDASGNTTRVVKCTVSCSGVSTTATCKGKTQTIQPLDSSTSENVSGLTITWSQSTDSGLAGNLHTKTSSGNIYSANLPIKAAQSGTDNDKQGTVTAKVSGYEVSKTFTITWPAGGGTPGGTTGWNLTVYYELTNNTSRAVSTKLYTNINGSEEAGLTPGNYNLLANDTYSTSKTISYTNAPGSQLTVMAYIKDVNDINKLATKTLTIAATNTTDRSVTVSLTWSDASYEVTGSWKDNDNTICHTDSIVYNFTAKLNGAANNNISGVTVTPSSAYSVSVSAPSNGSYTATITGRAGGGGETGTLKIPKGDGTYHEVTFSRLNCYSIAFTDSSPSINIATTNSLTINYKVYKNGTAQSSLPSGITVSSSQGNTDTYGKLVVAKGKFSTPSTTISISMTIGSTVSHCSDCADTSDSVTVSVSNDAGAQPYATFSVGSTSACHNTTVGVYYYYYTDQGVSSSKITGKDTVKFKVGSTEYSMSYNSTNRRYEGSVTITGDTTVTFPTQTGVLTPTSTSHKITRTDTYNISVTDKTVDSCSGTISTTATVKKNGTTDTSATITAGKILDATPTISGRTITWDVSKASKANREDGKSYTTTVSVGSGTCGASDEFKVTFKAKWTSKLE